MKKLLNSTIPTFVCLLLVLTSAACAAPANQAARNVPAKTTPQASPVPAKTPSPSQMTPMIPAEPVPPGFTLFTQGDGFLIAYPKDWTFPALSPDASGYADSVNFDDSTSNENFFVQSFASSDESSPPATIAHNCLVGITTAPPPIDYQQLTVAATRVVNGTTWYQSEAESKFGMGRARYVCLVTKHQLGADANRVFVLSYYADVQIFNRIDATVFEPMIQSFMFRT